ncbi:MAG: response regulator transcription factor [Ignavibacteriae bacterium]|nr:DNA-binding response regulator [Ignavibacteriota bacterium]NOG99201.1 response regulator transcription factor [Ignavibacteriota bacterium]
MRILVVEDEESLALRIKSLLESEKYYVETAFSGDSGLELALTEEYDLMILDILLPQISGLQILAEVRREKITTPILLLTSKDQIEDKVKGLDLGADDYLTKPFAIPELVARVRSLLRRESEVKSSVINLDSIEINTTTHEVRVNKKIISLTAKEYSILEFLIYNKNRVLSRLSIAEHVWGDNFDIFNMTNFVDVHIKNLRKKISQTAGLNPIETVRGVGYIVKDES